MSESRSRKVLLSVVGIVLVAAVTALLRASWSFWGPMVLFRAAGEWQVRWPVLLLIGGLAALRSLAGRKVDWSAEHVIVVVLAGIVLGLAAATQECGIPKRSRDAANVGSLAGRQSPSRRGSRSPALEGFEDLGGHGPGEKECGNCL